MWCQTGASTYLHGVRHVWSPRRRDIVLTTERGQELFRENYGVLVKPLTSLNYGDARIVRVKLHIGQEHLGDRNKSVSGPRSKPVCRRAKRSGKTTTHTPGAERGRAGQRDEVQSGVSVYSYDVPCLFFNSDVGQVSWDRDAIGGMRLRRAPRSSEMQPWKNRGGMSREPTRSRPHSGIELAAITCNAKKIEMTSAALLEERFNTRRRDAKNKNKI